MGSARGGNDVAADGVTIRPATSDDAAFIDALTARFAEAGRLSWRDEARLARFFERSVHEIAEIVGAEAINPRESILVATNAAAERLGFIHLRPELSILTREWEGYVNALAVTAEAEGREIDRALLAAGEAWAREQGFRHLTLDTFGTNDRARGFYGHLGFAEETLRLVKPL